MKKTQKAKGRAVQKALEKKMHPQVRRIHRQALGKE